MEQEHGRERLSDAELHLEQLLCAYRNACPEPEPGVNFMPELWAKIEARQNTTHLFGRMAKALVTVALAATVILGLMVSTASQPNYTFSGSYLEALTADHVSSLEPMNLERLSEMEQQ
ncbi:MAG: hypothetical protein M3N54_00790 [Acidobacteriota bacterium]|nr:hypothetical protein [Acidobacteriota bacterium]